MVEVWYLVLFLAGETIHIPGQTTDKDLCLETGTRLVKEFKTEHPHSRGWFWCYPGERL